jgi:hypothetical protein
VPDVRLGVILLILIADLAVACTRCDGTSRQRLKLRHGPEALLKN